MQTDTQPITVCLPGPRGLLLMMMLLSAAPLMAQPMDYGAYEALFGEPVTASVTGSPQRASNVPASMEIITRDEIRRSGARDIPGVLRHTVGVNVLNWTNSHSDVSLRGYNRAFSSRVLVMINGRQVYADHYGYTPWQALPVELHEILQIEIVKGPNSALFGFNAAGGIINIITFNPVNDEVDYVMLRGGTQGHRQGSAALTFPLLGDGRARVSAGARDSEDYDTPLRVANMGIRQGDERRSLRFDAHYPLAPNTELEVEASLTRAEHSSMGPGYAMAHEEMKTRSVKALLAADTRYGLVEASIYRNWIDNEVFASNTLDGINYAFSSEPVARFDNEVTVARLQDVFKPAPAHTIRLSGEYRESSLPTTPFEGAEIAYDVKSLSGMWQWQIVPGLTLSNAVRRDRLDLERSGSAPAGYPLDNADWDRRLTETSINSGLVWTLTERHTLKLTAARGVQLPSLFNLGASLAEIPIPPEFQPPSSFYTTGLPDLEPMTVDNYELALASHLPGVDLNLAVFAGKSRDVVADTAGFDLQRAILSSPANIGDSSTEGLELSLTGTTDSPWRWSLSYLYQQVDDDFNETQYPEYITLRNFEDTTPDHTLDLQFGWQDSHWEWDLFLRYQSTFSGLRTPEFDPENPFGVPDSVLTEIDDFVTIDGRVAYNLSDSITLSLSGQNLHRDTQRQTSGPLVERRVFGTVTVGF